MTTNTPNPSAAPEASEAHQAKIDAGKHALDDWTKVYLAPTGIPFELKPTGGVFRGMKDLEDAKNYADRASGFFFSHGIDKPVFVVKGPTSTTKCAFEVVAATAGYPVVYKASPMKGKGMTHEEIELAVVSSLKAQGWESVRGLAHASTKEYDTAVGIKNGFVRVGSLNSTGTGYQLEASYESEGRNVMASLFATIPIAAGLAEVDELVSKFTASADQVQAGTYAARLHRPAKMKP